MRNEKISYLYVSLAILLWGTTAAVGKLVLRNLNNLQVLFYASLIATIALFVLVLFQKKLVVLRSYKVKDYLRFAYMGFLGVFTYYALLYAGIQFAPAQEAFIINYTWPIWVMVFASLLLNEVFNVRKIIAVILSFVGVYVVASHGNLHSISFQYLKGDLFALLAAVAYGLFSVLSKKHDDDKVASTMLYYAFAFVFIAIVCPIVSSVPAVTSKEVAGLLWLGIFTSGLAFVFWLSALKHGDTAKMSNMVLLTPFASLICSYLLVGEQIQASSVVGCALIVAGIILQSLTKKPKPAIVTS